MLTSIIFLLSLHLSSLAYGSNTSQCKCAPSNSLACDRVVATDNLDSHDEAELHGACLYDLNVPANTMKCFKWGHKECLENSDLVNKCRLIFQNSIEIRDMDSNGRTRIFESPGFTRTRRGAKNRHFCVYNISLNCSGHRAELYTTEGISRSNVRTDSCKDYVKFYTNSTSQEDLQLCGDNFGNFRATLNSNSFVAVLWTDIKPSFGKFQMVANCGAAIVPPQPAPGIQEPSAEQAC